jgi:hypothetical protein
MEQQWVHIGEYEAQSLAKADDVVTVQAKYVAEEGGSGAAWRGPVRPTQE